MLNLPTGKLCKQIAIVFFSFRSTHTCGMRWSLSQHKHVECDRAYTSAHQYIIEMGDGRWAIGDGRLKYDGNCLFWASIRATDCWVNLCLWPSETLKQTGDAFDSVKASPKTNGSVKSLAQNKINQFAAFAMARRRRWIVSISLANYNLVQIFWKKTNERTSIENDIVMLLYWKL